MAKPPKTIGTVADYRGSLQRLVVDLFLYDLHNTAFLQWQKTRDVAQKTANAWTDAHLLYWEHYCAALADVRSQLRQRIEVSVDGFDLSDARGCGLSPQGLGQSNRSKESQRPNAFESVRPDSAERQDPNATGNEAGS